jgi:hypothetical protein
MQDQTELFWRDQNYRNNLLRYFRIYGGLFKIMVDGVFLRKRPLTEEASAASNSKCYSRPPVLRRPVKDKTLRTGDSSKLVVG